MPGSLILINGASSAGKTTLCRALRDALPRTPGGDIRDWPHLRPQVFQGFNRCLPALLNAGNNLVVDYISETPGMWAEFRRFLQGHDVFLVGLRCPALELERRDAETVHTFTAYDLELHERPWRHPGDNVQQVIQGWQGRPVQPFGLTS